MLPYNQDRFVDGDETSCHTRNPGTLDGAIQLSRQFLLSLQHPDGYWWGELEGNSTITSQTVFLYKILGIDDRYPMYKMENYIRRIQCAHGGWELFHGDGGSLSATIESYMALRLLNAPKTDPALQRALEFITSRGGVTKARMFTKICLALLGCYDWMSIPSLPPWLVLLPSWFPFSIYEMASWARGCVVPLTVVFDRKPVFKVSPEVCFDELYSEGKEKARRFQMPFGRDWTSNLFVGVDYVLKAMARLGLVPFRQRGLKEAEKWLLKRQEDTGDYNGTYPPIFYSLVCMRILGYDPTDPVLHKAISSFATSLAVETEDEYFVQSSVSPVWDTALTIRALVESGLEPDHPALQRAGEWLLKKQITKHGDWAYKSLPCGRRCAGGWAFQFLNRWYPDVDDTAVVAMALNSVKLPNEDVKNGAIARSVEWISSMQCKAGGWAAYDRDCDQNWLNYTPFGDLKAMIDPNTVDVTARVLEMVGTLKKESRHDAADRLPSQAIGRGLAYLRKEQEKEGCWYGRWGVNYIYGTCGALLALSLIAPSTHAKEIERGARWLVEVQNLHAGHGANGRIDGGAAPAADGGGGWGETCFSYDDVALKGRSEASTASQTAWALQGLLAAGDAMGKYEVEAIEKGVQYLISSQRKDGSWQEAQFTGCGLPSHFYLRYHLYAQHFPLSALSRYRARARALTLAPPYCLRRGSHEQGKGSLFAINPA